MLTISLHFFIDMMEGCLPFLHEDDGDMLTISLHFFIDMMVTISLHFFIDMMEGC
jgi:hypothetical protein